MSGLNHAHDSPCGHPQVNELGDGQKDGGGQGRQRDSGGPRWTVIGRCADKGQWRGQGEGAAVAFTQRHNGHVYLRGGEAPEDNFYSTMADCGSVRFALEE